ncbi:GyrI-like domain-containing protein [Bacillus marinisedimentorum]|uniref:GyrI-like domain-containing protein n=1 Tax=Bacillus marinisedimentorum TaxID=1821260 RepID=UPI001FE0B272|nr:GyrI-like domain-containing protein [Bacillus marinisedimentorum]
MLKRNWGICKFGTEVPVLAQQLLLRSNEIHNHSETEIAFFQPKKDLNHLEGHYYAGLIVNDPLNDVPPGMSFIETAQSYVTTRGKVSNIGNLHAQLLKWAKKQGYQRDLESYIVETYHQMEKGEEVEIYLPVRL